MPAQTKLDVLIKAGVIDREDAAGFSPDLKQRIESLTDEEIAHLIAAKAKLGKYPSRKCPLIQV